MADLRRILASFLCMAAPVQLFGFILVLLGWNCRQGFMVYSGGLVLIMSGSLQLLAVGTSILLFDVELQRSPADLYQIPVEVEVKFGYSAYAAWIACACALFSGVFCALAPTLALPSVKTRHQQERSFENGDTLHMRSMVDLEADVEVNINTDHHTPLNTPNAAYSVSECVPVPKPVVKERNRLERQSFSEDTGNYFRTINTSSTLNDGTKNWAIDNKTHSVPNLKSDHCQSIKLRSGRSSRRKYRRRCARNMSPVATVRTPRAAILALEKEKVFSREFDEDSEKEEFENIVNWSRKFSESVDDRMFAAEYPSVPMMNSNSLKIPPSPNAPILFCDSSISTSTLVSVSTSQRLRHARYARRTSYNSRSCDEAMKSQTQEPLTTLLPPQGAITTRSLPRPCMKRTPLSELASKGDMGALRDHCELFLARHTPGATCSDYKGGSGRISPLVPLQRQHSADARSARHHSMHPAVWKWRLDGSQWSKSLDEATTSTTLHTAQRDLAIHPMSGLVREATLDKVEEEFKSLDQTTDSASHEATAAGSQVTERAGYDS